MFRRYVVGAALLALSWSACGGRAVQNLPDSAQEQDGAANASPHANASPAYNNALDASENPNGRAQQDEEPLADKEYSILEMNDVVNTLRPHVYRCYAQQLQRDRGARGRLELQIRVNTGGHVDEAKVLRSSFDDAMGTCVLDHAKVLQFEPLPANGSITLQKVFILSVE